MEKVVKTVARLARASGAAWERKWRFLGIFVIVLTTSFVFLVGLGLTPDPGPVAEASPLVAGQSLASALSADAAAAPVVATVNGEIPLTIRIPSIGLAASVANPSSTSIDALDAALLSGAVRYPTSATLGEEGNVVIFGHSSYLPVVHNLAYKTFDGIQNLKVGDSIIVSSSNVAYTYRVETVMKADATSAAIPLNITGKELTLSTCDSFGTKSDRFIVTASFVESHAISS